MEVLDEWTIFAVVGTGVAGFSGDGGPAAKAQLNWPRDMAVAPDGSLFVADTNNHRIRRIRPDGVIETVAGAGPGGYGGDGALATQALLNAPRGVDVAADGTLLVADTANHCIRRIDRHGRISTLAGTGRSGFNGDGIPATEAQLSWLQALIVTEDGCIYVADSGNHRIRKITPDGLIATIAGTGVAAWGGDDGLAIDAQLSHPRGVAIDRTGSLYVGDSDNNRVRRITPDGVITTTAGTGQAGLCGDGGPATKAEIAGPRGVAVADDGSLWIADCDNFVIRKVTPEGIIATVAGVGVEGYEGDGGPATTAKLGDPHGICGDVASRIFFAEPHNHCIRGLAVSAES